MPAILPKPYELSVERGVRGLQLLRAAWLALERRIATPRFAQTWRWQFAAAAHLLGGECEPVYAHVTAAGTSVAIVALQPGEPLRVGPLSFGRLSSPRHAHLALNDWPIDPRADVEHLLATLVDGLRRAALPRWSVLDFERLPETSGALAVLRRQPRTLVQPDHRSAWFDCAAQGDAPVPKKLRRNLRRLRARAETLGPVRSSTHAGAAALGEAFEHFLAVESSGWKGTDGTGSAIALDPALSGFYRALATSDGDALECRINLLHVGDQVVAAQFALASARTLNLLKIGYREEHAEFAPGLLLLEDCLDACTADAAFDRVSLVTAPHWAERWHPTLEQCHSVRVFAPSLAGSLAYGLQQVRERARVQHPPRPTGPAATDEASPTPATS